jgi:phosphoglycerate dehydrogenase-like enzyme
MTMPAARKPAVVIAARNVLLDGSAETVLAQAGVEVILVPGSWDVLRDHGGPVDAMIVGAPQVGASVLDLMPGLRFILRAGAGTDNIDVAETDRRGIRVEALPGMNAESVADYVFGLLIGLSRKIPYANAEVRAGRWQGIAAPDVYGATLGLIGFGHIGRAVARRANGFGMTVLVSEYARLDRSAVRELGVEVRSLEQLLAEADFVSLHAPLNDQTRRLLDARAIALMKPGAMLVNTSRGQLIDEHALSAALRSGQLAGAALDVFAEEPYLDGPLLEVPNAIVSPHTASNGLRTMRRVAERSAERVLEVLGLAS